MVERVKYLFISVTTAAIFFLCLLTYGTAAELVMFRDAACPYCAQFDHEIAPVYPKTTEGRRAPLRYVDVSTPLPPDLAFVERERLTPLFVLVEDGKEIGRIRGYPGDDHFWGLLGVLLTKLDRIQGVKKSGAPIE